MPTLPPWAETFGQLLAFLFIVGQQVFQQRKLRKIETNDLHELPLIVPELTRMNDTLQRIEVKQGEEFSYIRARLNGK